MTEPMFYVVRMWERLDQAELFGPFPNHDDALNFADAWTTTGGSCYATVLHRPSEIRNRALSEPCGTMLRDNRGQPVYCGLVSGHPGGHYFGPKEQTPDDLRAFLLT